MLSNGTSFSSTTSRDWPSSFLLIHPDGVDHMLLRGEHLLLLLVAKVLLQVKSPPVASLAPSSTVPAWHILALFPRCSLQIISEESDAETLYWCVYINDPARSSGIIHLSLYTLPFGDSHLGTPSDWDVCEMSVPSGETLIFVYTNCHFLFYTRIKQKVTICRTIPNRYIWKETSQNETRWTSDYEN